VQPGEASPGSLSAGIRKPAIADYELIRVIGRGSYGDVWLARGITGSLCALKVIWRDRFSDVRPFDREFRGLKQFAALSHGDPGQMAVLHIGRSEAEGYFYYVMELADDASRGRDIDPGTYVPNTLREVRARRGRLPAKEVVAIGIAVARDLASLHRRDLVHRDVKPSNIILVSGVAKLADIGLVAPAASAQTYVGTEGFIPPEGPGALTADVYGLGLLLYELATGLDRRDYPRLPDDLAALPDRRDLLALNEVLVAAGDPDPAARPADASALLALLVALQEPAHDARRPLGVSAWGWAAAALAVLLVGGLLIRHRGMAVVERDGDSGREAFSGGISPTDKSIAVLPFTNLGDSKEDNFFSEGIQQDILTHLSTISALRVVSRPTVLRFRDSSKSPQEIGREISAAYILVGSVRRSGSMMRLDTQLINTATNAQVWAKSFDRNVDDVFAIQSELSQTIAEALQARIAPQEAELLNARPTDNVAAYDLFLKGQRVWDNAPAVEDGVREQRKFYQAAVDMDPKFARAWSALAGVDGFMVNYALDTSPERVAKGRTEAAEAIRLAPDSPEIILGQGDFILLADRNFPRAAEYYKRVISLEPNDGVAHSDLANTLTMEGRHKEGLAELRIAASLDPGNTDVESNLLEELRATRHFAEALECDARIVAADPTNLSLGYEYAELKFATNGDKRPVEAFFAGLGPAKEALPEVRALHKEWCFVTADLKGYIKIDEDRNLKPFYTPRTPAEQAIESATVHLLDSDPEGAKARLGTFHDELKAQLAREPNNDRVCNNLAGIEAILGNRDEALRLLQRGTELALDLHDDRVADIVTWRRAQIFSLVGDKDAAIAELKGMLERPAYYTANELRYSASYLPLHGDPRFEALVADPAYGRPLF